MVLFFSNKHPTGKGQTLHTGMHQCHVSLPILFTLYTNECRSTLPIIMWSNTTTEVLRKPGLLWHLRLNTPEIFHGFPVDHGNNCVRKPSTSSFCSEGRCQVLLEKKTSISIELVGRRKPEELWNLLLDGRVDSGLHKNTVMSTYKIRPQSFIGCGNSTPDTLDLPLHCSSRIWDLEFQMKYKS